MNDPHENLTKKLQGVIAPGVGIRHLSDQAAETPPGSRYRGLPVVFLVRPTGVIEPAPFLMTPEDVADLFRLHQAATRFPKATLRRYRKRGLKSARVGRRTWYTLPDVLDFLDEQQRRVAGGHKS